VFLTMELLRGETLSDRLERGGLMSPAEALPIAVQISQALEAAHANGVVHRDLKSGNVFLVDAPGGPRAVVTDFGLAGSTLAEAPVSATLTATGELVGSPAYMAPEQVRGEESTSATDIYAFGIVLYEMVTGELPFVGKSAFYTALKRLQEPPPSPRSKTPDLPAVWDEAILRCLETDPADRFRHARHVVRALGVTRGQEDATSPVYLPRRRRSRLFRPAAAGMAALFLVLALGLIVTRDRWRTKPAPAAAEAPQEERVRAPRRAVAVLRFENLSGEKGAAYLGDALFQMLPTELTASGDLRLIPSEEIDRAIRDLALSEPGGLSASTLFRLRTRLGADLVVTGAYLVMGGERRTRFDLLTQDTRTGETVAVLQEAGTEEAFLSTLAVLGERMRERLGTRPPTESEAEAVRASRPSNLKAARLYAEGLASLRRFEGVQARDLLRQAVEADPDNPLLHSALGAAWSALGYDDPAKAEAKQAFELSARLRREDRRFIEARYREAAQEWGPAIAIYRELADYFPDDLEYGLRLAAAQTVSGAPADTMTTLETLKRLSAAGSADPRLELAEAEAARALSDARRQQAAAVRAEQKAVALGARSLVAQALFSQGQAALALGEPATALEKLTESARIYGEVGDRAGLARSTNARGVALEGQGDSDGAEDAYQEALAIYRKIGYQAGAAGAINNLAIFSIRQGRLDEARERLQQALAAFRVTGRKAAAANALNNLGAIADMEGDQDGFRARLEEALAIYREVGDQGSEARTRLNLGRSWFTRGDLAAMERETGEALRIYRALGDRSNAALALQDQGALWLQRGDLEKAERTFQEAAALQRSLGEKANLADSLLDLAVVALERGDPRLAEKRAQEALALFNEAGLGGRETEVTGFLARCDLERGETGPASEKIAKARKDARKTDNLRSHLVLEITHARVLAAQGQPGEAIPILQAAVRDARKAGFLPIELEARLVLGKVEISAGREAGRRRLAELKGEARGRGFELIARKAESSPGTAGVPPAF
jgi:tetratricopeptide (TPR) repeat protein/TolB-like protein